MTEAYQDRGSGGRRLITARQFLAGLDQREGLAGVHAQRFQHFRGQYLADAALQSQPTVAKTAVGRPSRSFGAKVKQPTRAIAKLREKKAPAVADIGIIRSEEHTSELQSLMRTSYTVFCLKQKKQRNTNTRISI